MPPLHTLPEFCPKDLADWRRWLKKHHAKSEGVWLVFYKKASGKQGLTYSEAVDEALCWGWIDSKMNPIDEERYKQVYTPRKPGSVWSALNKRKIAAMEAQGRMQPTGRARIDAAMADGSWGKFDGVEALEIPPELAQPLAANAAAPADCEDPRCAEPGKDASAIGSPLTQACRARLLARTCHPRRTPFPA
jgi:uncharacterized protein YdeI (YjbR/CyaY-like superfamily)